MNETTRKVQICLRGVESSYGSMAFHIPKHIAEKMNKKGKFLITVEEIKDFSYSRGRVIIEPIL